jgi:pyruvate ferredoxin oxidoreductase beta subunit
MTAIAVAHQVPYVAQAAANHWDDLSRKVERAVAAEGPAFLNVLTDCPLGWGHEPRLSPQVLDAAVDSLYWPLYEVVDGTYRLTYRPQRTVDIEEWLRPQKRFAHLLRPENAALVDEIRSELARDWFALVKRCSDEGG